MLPAPLVYGALAVLLVWLIGVFFLERLSNFLVSVGLLVSSEHDHFFTLPVVGTGMTLRTITALVGVMLVVGGVFFFLNLIDRNDPDMPEAPPPPARDALPPMDPMMDFGPDPYGMPPMGGGFGGPPPPVGGIGTGVPPGF